MRESWDDERLLGALRAAMEARRAVPPEFIATGKSAYAWRNIDAELAQLTYDSRSDKERSASLRSEEPASVRALTFTSAHFSIELEIADTALLGQIMPPRKATIETETRAGLTTAAPVDDIGCFAIEPRPASPFRLHCRAEDGQDVVTGWITL